MRTHVKLALVSTSACVSCLVALASARGPSTEERDREASLVAAVVAEHNRMRREEGLPPLEADARLARVAQGHADDMAARGSMTHDGSDGSTPAQRLDRSGYEYRSMAENVARGQDTAASVVKAWMDSPGHRANILDAFDRIGVAVARDSESRPFWSVTFARTWPRLDPARASTEVVSRVNAARKKAGKPVLRDEPRLARAAADLARTMARAEPDAPPKSADLGKILEASGYRFARVTLLAASGQPTPEELVASWNSDDADRGKLVADVADAGAAFVAGRKGSPHWCLLLARPASHPRR